MNSFKMVAHQGERARNIACYRPGADVRERPLLGILDSGATYRLDRNLHMSDPRDVLLSELHKQYLKPLGFKKTGRRIERESADGLRLTVHLESGPAIPFDTVYFGIELAASHAAASLPNGLLSIGLSSYAENVQRWKLEYGEPAEPLLEKITALFSKTGLNLLQRMSSLDGLVELYPLLDAMRYRAFYRGQVWCLNELGRRNQAADVIRQVIAQAPNPRFRTAAELVLQEQLLED